MWKNSALMAIVVTLMLISNRSVANQTINYLVLSEMAVPFQIEQEDVSQGGIITEIVEAVFESSDYNLKTKVFPLSRLHHEVNTNHVANWISYDAKAWNSFGDKGELIDIPLFEVTHDLLTCDPTIQEVTDDSELQGKSIAILENFHYLRLQELAKTGQVTLVPVKGYSSGIMMSNKSRVHGFVEMSLRLKYNVEVLRKRDDCQRYVNFSHVIPPYSIYLTVDRNMSNEAKQFVIGRLQAMSKKGQLREIFDHWNKY